jgi:uncharacterized protein (TIGR02118 family)
MLAVTILYPQNPGTHFDHAYYRERHLPLVRDRLGAACRALTVEQGLAGGDPGTPAPFVAGCRLEFESIGDFQAAFAAHAAEFMADVPNYTDRAPLVHVASAAAL